MTFISSGLKKILLLTFFLFLAGRGFSEIIPDSTLVYKEINGVTLSMSIFFPPNHKMTDQIPAILFFHGGNWKGGDPSHFYGQARYLASRGMVAMSAQYRTENANKTTPIECVKDGKSAMRWVYSHARELGVDPDRIIAGGGSAGGQIAAATAIVTGFNEAGEDTTISCRPKALVLLNPVANNGPEGYAYPRVKDYWKDFSPYHNLDETAPPTIIMLGTEDKLFTPALAKVYKKEMESFGLRCDLLLYEGQGHAFFNKGISTEMHYQTMIDADKFLISLGYLSGQSASLEELLDQERFEVKVGLDLKDKPNLLIIHTDEHNLRTLGAYRDTMTKEQAEMWGKNVIVKTPNIDKIAKEGAICTNWYATSPVCTPSRASMMTGLYPVATNSHINNRPMFDHMQTFASILKDNGYSTSYVGKWHLDGDAKPGFQPERNFGFDDNRYMFNRGHWKILADDGETAMVDQPRNNSGGADFDPARATTESFATDYLVDQCMDILDRDKYKPFCLMLSLPDPHGPDQVRAPYDTMYNHLQFELPSSSVNAEENSPKWVIRGKKNSINKNFQKNMVNYYGMVKCIDDNVGRLLKFLEENGLDQNTVVVFTSDHGDLLGEHGKLNKGLPYEMSAKVAFLLRYPEQVKSGKQIKKTFTMADFTPTVLGLMGVDHTEYDFHGIDASSDFKSDETKITDERTVYITNAFSRWVAAVDGRYKLVLSPNDEPWLFDLKNDPDERVNYYKDAEYKEIGIRLTKELLSQLKKYDDPILSKEQFKF